MGLNQRTWHEDVPRAGPVAGRWPLSHCFTVGGCGHAAEGACSWPVALVVPLLHSRRVWACS
eukprot:365725-Chlamydomonas_euryale.AAC.9